MQHLHLKDIVDEISVRENNPAGSQYDKFVGLEHYVSGEVEIHDFGSTARLASAMKVFKSGDILIARRNVYLRRAGVVKFDGLTSGDSIVLRAKDEEIAKLLPFIFNTSDFWDYADQNSDGTMSKRLSPKILLEYEVNLPEPEELGKLADLLWAAEETRQAYKKLIKQTDDLVQAKFTEMFGDINRIPGTKKLKDIVTIRDDLRAPLNDAARADMKEGVLYPYYGATGCVDHINKYKIDFKAICIAEDCGSYAAGDDSAYMINEKCWVNNHAHVLKAKDEVCIPEFLNYYFKVVDLTAYVSGTTRAKLTRGKLEEIPIVLPELSAQKQFVEFLQQAEQTKLATQQSLSALNATVRALMNQNFN